jgi:hypothetical protein
MEEIMKKNNPQSGASAKQDKSTVLILTENVSLQIIHYYP